MSDDTKITTTTPADTIGALIERAKPEFAKVLPQHLTADRLARVTLSCIRRTPKLLKCSQASLMQSIMQAAQLGLEPTGSFGGAHLVPYGTEATLIIDYRGLVDIARRTGQIQSIEAHAVMDADHFECEFGLSPKLVHRPLWDGDRGKLRLVYAIAMLKDGGQQVEVMSKGDVDAIRKRSKASGSGPWVTDYERMALKTVLRRLCQLLPRSVEMADALRIDAETDGIDLAAQVRQPRSGVAALSRLSGEARPSLPESLEESPAEHEQQEAGVTEDDEAHRIELAEVLLAGMAELNAGQRTALLRAAGATTLPHGWTVAEVAELPASVLAAALKASA